MFSKISKLMFFSAFFVVIAGCASGTFHTDGLVVNTAKDNVTVYTSDHDNYIPGQVLETYRFTPSDATYEGDDLYVKQQAGRVIVEKIINKNYAKVKVKVKVLGGSIKRHDVVELSK